jgi:ribosome-binding protein aMBF1 (putative translation factor)
MAYNCSFCAGRQRNRTGNRANNNLGIIEKHLQLPDYSEDLDLSTQAGRIRQAHHKKNLTIKELAELTGLSPECIGAIENGKRSPTIVTIKMLADALDAPVWYLGCFENLPESTTAQRIKKARLFHGLSQVQLAESWGVSERIIYDWETGRYQPGKKYFAILEKYLNVLN